MRGLPAIPPDVCRIRAVWDVAGDICSTAWYLFAPGVDTATTVQLDGLLDGFFLSPANDILGLLGTDVSLARLDCVTFGSSPLTQLLVPAPNAGALGSSQTLNAAMVLTWQTAERRVRSRQHTFLPLSGSHVGTDKRRLSPLGYSEAIAQAQRFLAHVNALTSPDGATCVLVAVHRSAARVPLHASLAIPVESAGASPRVGTLRRRIAAAPRSQARI